MKKDLENKIKEEITEINKLLANVINVKIISDEDIPFKKIVEKIEKPHPYIFYVLFKSLNYIIHGKNLFQKSLWHVILEYKSHFFIINEYFFTIQMYADEISSDTEEIAQDLIDKLIDCCDLLDNLFQNHFKEDIKSKKCYVNNIYWNVKRIYEFFRDMLKEEKKYDSIIEVLKEMKSNEGFIFSLILSFFSTCEFILDIFYIFDNPKGAFFKFQKKNWYNKFEDVFGPYNLPEIEKI